MLPTRIPTRSLLSTYARFTTSPFLHPRENARFTPDFSGREIEVSALERLEDGGVGDVGAGGDPLPLDVELAVEELEVFRGKSVVGEGNVEGGAIAHVVQTEAGREKRDRSSSKRLGRVMSDVAMIVNDGT